MCKNKLTDHATIIAERIAIAGFGLRELEIVRRILAFAAPGGPVVLWCEKDPVMAKANPSLFFVLFYITLTGIGAGIVVPVMPVLVERMVPGGEASASGAFGLLLSCHAAALFLSSPVIGNVSDCVGRKPIIVVTLAGLTLDYAIAASTGSYAIFLSARIVSGACGGSWTAAAAYVADVSPPEKRAANFGLMIALSAAGFVIGPAIGGLLGTLGLRAPFWVAAAIAFGSLIYALLVLPESLPSSSRRPLDLSLANPFASITWLLRSAVLRWSAIALLLWYLAQAAIQATFVMFAQLRFHWDQLSIGLFVAAYAGAIVFASGYMTRILAARLGNARAVLLGLAILVVSNALFGLASHAWQLYVLLIPLMLGMIAAPLLQSTVSQVVGAAEQGKLQGALGSLEPLAQICGPLAATWLFARYAGVGDGSFQGVGFYFAASLTLGALASAVLALYERRSVTKPAGEDLAAR